MTDVSHCLPCATEYIAGIAACAECGGQLSPGPLPRNPPDVRETTDASAPATDRVSDPPDTYLAEIPGLQAEHAAKALTLEGIACALDCLGLRRLRHPGQDPAEPFAVTLPVSIFVPRSQLDEARGILQSLAADDLIGDQWHGTGDQAGPGRMDRPATKESCPCPSELVRPAEPPLPTTSRSEGTTLRLVILLILAGLVLFLIR